MGAIHRHAALSTKEDRKSQIVLDFNKTKGGVDLDKRHADTDTQLNKQTIVVFFCA